jgi:hypothetical protein
MSPLVREKHQGPDSADARRGGRQPGTFPIQSERFYMALKGQGATVRYVTLPYEAHGYAGRETLLHVLAERINWFDKYVKNAPPRNGDKATDSQ